MKFDLSPIPAAATIQSAKLALYTFKIANSCCDPFGPMAQGDKFLYKNSATWDESKVNWNNKPAVSSSSIGQCKNTNVKVWEEFDVTATVKEMVATPTSNYGFMMRCKESTSDMGITIYSSEYKEQAYRPKLTVVYDLGTAIQPNTLIKIPLEKSYAVTVYNVQGKTIASYVTEDISRLNEMLPIGMHIVKVNNKELKIYKQR